ncbi:MAG: Gfo/Idh/MocA family protein [Ilumatobacter sp.]
MSDPVGFGVIGANSFVANAAVLPAIDAAPNARLVATASRSSAVPERWSDTDVDTYDAVLAHPEVEAVYLPLPNGLHEAWTRRCAAAGKHVLCEKPLAWDAATARSMATACNDAGVLLAEAWMTPFHARYREVLDRARAGDIGDIVSIDGSFRFTIGPEAADNYRWDRNQGGGALLDVGIYCLGAIVELFDAHPTNVVAHQQLRGGVDAETSAVLDWSGRRLGSISCSFVGDESQELSIAGTLGRLVIPTEAFTGGVNDSGYVQVTPAFDGTAADVVVHDGANDSYQSMVEAFATAVRGETEWPRPVERSIEMLNLIERIKESAVD